MFQQKRRAGRTLHPGVQAGEQPLGLKDKQHTCAQPRQCACGSSLPGPSAAKGVVWRARLRQMELEWLGLRQDIPEARGARGLG